MGSGQMWGFSFSALGVQTLERHNFDIPEMPTRRHCTLINMLELMSKEQEHVVQGEWSILNPV